LSLPPRPHPSFAAVVLATAAGVQNLKVQDYDYIGLLDSDVRFEPDYFKRVLRTLESLPRLGLAGGVVVDTGSRRNRLPRNRRDVPGAVQFFRRGCFEALGGLLAIPEGGWDALTCARARMLGFETRLLPDLIVEHLKQRNVSEGGLFRRQWQMGVRDYALGYHPLFELLKCLDRLADSPPLLGAVARGIGYLSSALEGRKRLVPLDLQEFIRAEQLSRIKRSLKFDGSH
jgi:GT2 family glycosyltransferase